MGAVVKQCFNSLNAEQVGYEEENEVPFLVSVVKGVVIQE
jgi:hypothetical protein